MKGNFCGSHAVQVNGALCLCSLVAAVQPFAGMRHLDVAGGTGDVAFRVLRAMQVSFSSPLGSCTSMADAFLQQYALWFLV